MIPLIKKRKQILQEEEDQHIESGINIISLEDIDIQVDIKKFFSNID
jgi:hypothetical protein